MFGAGEPAVTELQRETWNVIALGFDASDADVVDGLQRVFGIDRETAVRVLRSTPRAVKHDVPRELALMYGEALSAIGGRYELQPSSDAFMETSAGEHASPVLRKAHGGVVPDHLEAPGQIGAEYSLGDEAMSGLEIDVAHAQRTVQQGNADPRQGRKEIARASMSSFPPAASQSLPPPRMTYALPPAAEPSPPDRSGLLLIVGVLLIVISVIGARTFLVGDLAIGDPVLKAVGGLMLARGIWKRLSK